MGDGTEIGLTFFKTLVACDCNPSNPETCSKKVAANGDWLV